MSWAKVRLLLIGFVLGIIASQAWGTFAAKPQLRARPDSSPSAPTPASPPSVAVAPPGPAPTPSGDAHLKNGAVVPLTKVLPADDTKATVKDGVSFYTLNYRARETTATVRIKVSAFASAAQPNVAVIAVFRVDQSAPLGLVSKPLSGDRRESIELNVTLPKLGRTPLSLDFRIGPGKPGTIVLNGPADAAEPATTEIRVNE